MGCALHEVEMIEEIDLLSLLGPAYSCRRCEIQNRIAGCAELRALKRSGHKAGAPIWRTRDRAAAMIQKDHKRRQVLILGTQPVRDPRAEAGISLPDKPGIHLEQSGAMGETVGVTSSEN